MTRRLIGITVEWTRVCLFDSMLFHVTGQVSTDAERRRAMRTLERVANLAACAVGSDVGADRRSTARSRGRVSNLFILWVVEIKISKSNAHAIVDFFQVHLA